MTRVRPSSLLVFALLCVIRMALRSAGFGRTVAAVSRMTKRYGKQANATTDEVRQIVSQVAEMAALFPGRARCLEQSLVSFLILRRGGLDVTFRMGAQPHGFIAHAWVEFHGDAVTDTTEVVSKLVPFPDMIS